MELPARQLGLMQGVCCHATGWAGLLVVVPQPVQHAGDSLQAAPELFPAGLVRMRWCPTLCSSHTQLLQAI